MFNVHVISDLEYGFNESTDPSDSVIPPEADLVIFNGNLGIIKRSMLYTYELALKYPDVQFVYNFGEMERYWRVMPKFEWEGEDNMAIRIANNQSWPKNLHWKDPRTDEGLIITLRTGQTISVFPIFGFPKINSYTGDWSDTYWHKNFCVQFEYKDQLDKWPEKPKETSFVSHGVVPVWFTQAYMNQRFSEMETRVRNWELNLKHFGILVTHINPFKDPRCENCSVSPYLIHLNKMLWVTAKTPVNGINYLGAKLYSNPGRGSEARSKIISVD